MPPDPDNDAESSDDFDGELSPVPAPEPAELHGFRRVAAWMLDFLAEFLILLLLGVQAGIFFGVANWLLGKPNIVSDFQCTLIILIALASAWEFEYLERKVSREQSIKLNGLILFGIILALLVSSLFDYNTYQSRVTAEADRIKSAAERTKLEAAMNTENFKRGVEVFNRISEKKRVERQNAESKNSASSKPDQAPKKEQANDPHP